MPSPITNTIFAAQKTSANSNIYIGTQGTLFYDPQGLELKISDGITPGGLLFAGGGVGPQGPQGNQGSYGGPQGFQGFQGFQGHQGTQGVVGFQGVQGNQIGRASCRERV